MLVGRFKDSFVASDSGAGAVVFSVLCGTLFCTVTNVGAEPVAFSFDGDAAKGNGCVPTVCS